MNHPIPYTRIAILCLTVFLCTVVLESCRSADSAAAEDGTVSSVEDQLLSVVWTDVDLDNLCTEVRILPPEEIIGLGHEHHSDAAPVTVDGKTVLLLSTTAGYAAVWTEAAYTPGEIPTGTLYCFDEIDMTDAALEPSIVLRAYPDALNGRTFSFGWGWSSATAVLYCFDELDTLWEMDTMRGYFAVEKDADGDGSVDLMLKDFNYKTRLWSWSDGKYRTADADTVPGTP